MSPSTTTCLWPPCPATHGNSSWDCVTPIMRWPYGNTWTARSAAHVPISRAYGQFGFRTGHRSWRPLRVRSVPVRQLLGLLFLPDSLPLVMRIVLSLEPCYLVSAEFDVSSSRKAISFLCNCRDQPVCAASEPRPSGSLHIVRFYDHLSKIPRLKVMLKCNQRRPDPRPDSRIQLTLDDVIQEARDNQDARCTDNAAACRPGSSRRNSRIPD